MRQNGQRKQENVSPGRKFFFTMGRVMQSMLPKGMSVNKWWHLDIFNIMSSLVTNTSEPHYRIILGQSTKCFFFFRYLLGNTRSWAYWTTSLGPEYASPSWLHPLCVLFFYLLLANIVLYIYYVLTFICGCVFFCRLWWQSVCLCKGGRISVFGKY